MYCQSHHLLYRLKMGSRSSMVLFTHNVKKIKGTAHKNGEKSAGEPLL